MSRRDRPPIPVVLTLPAEVDAILLAADEILGVLGSGVDAAAIPGAATEEAR